MRKFHAYYDDNTQEFKGIKDSDGRMYDNIDRIVDKLNTLEEYRVKQAKRITDYSKREGKYQRIISGLMAYLELRLNDELWWDWNE